MLLGVARELQRDQLGTYARAMAKHGDIARFRIGPPGIGFVFDAVFTPSGARQVLTTDAGHYEKDAPVIGEFRHFLGDGLLVSKGERWRQHRRIVQPLFTRRAVDGYAETIASSASDLLTWLATESAGGDPVDLHSLSMRWALHVLGRTVFGNDIERVAPTLRDLLPPLGEHLKRRALAPLRTPHSWPTPANRRGEEIRQAVWGLADGLIADRRADGATGDDLLSRLLRARDPHTGEGLTDDDVRDEAIIFLIAGHETTGSVLAFTLHLLGHRPEVQGLAREEASGGPDEDRPYTRAVINEAMRLYPPAHTVVRRAVTDTEIGGCPVDSGRIVAVNIWGIHHRPDIWPEPEQFRPERFSALSGSDESTRRATNYAHVPFAGGPRSCIGEHLAMAELVGAVSAVVGRYRLESLVDEPDVEVDLSLRPRGALPCRVASIDKG